MNGVVRVRVVTFWPLPKGRFTFVIRFSSVLMFNVKIIVKSIIILFDMECYLDHHGLHEPPALEASLDVLAHAIETKYTRGMIPRYARSTLGTVTISASRSFPWSASSIRSPIYGSTSCAGRHVLELIHKHIL